MLTVIIYCICISTHSLTRRLTNFLFISILHRIISTHSLTRRLTIVSENHAQSMGHFNSQPHKEADLDQLVEALIVLYFNSQPHKEADTLNTTVQVALTNFNSQPHKEADSAEADSTTTSDKFQLTASQGG